MALGFWHRLLITVFYVVNFRSAGGVFGKMEAAREEQYFRKLVNLT